MDRSTRIIDCHVKGWLEGGFLKTTIQEVVLGRKFGRGLIHNKGLRRLKGLGDAVKDFKLFCEVQRRL